MLCVRLGWGCLLVANGLLDLANGIGLYYFMWFRSFKYVWLVWYGWLDYMASYDVVDYMVILVYVLF